MQFIEISAKATQNIDRAFETMVREIREKDIYYNSSLKNVRETSPH